VEKEYVANKNFIKYLGVPLESRKVSKVKFIEAKIQKVLEELDNVEFSGLAINQIILEIRCYILNKLYYKFAIMNIPKDSLKIIDEKVRKVINQFVKGQRL
jgi:hypothetical protein